VEHDREAALVGQFPHPLRHELFAVGVERVGPVGEAVVDLEAHVHGIGEQSLMRCGIAVGREQEQRPRVRVGPHLVADPAVLPHDVGAAVGKGEEQAAPRQPVAHPAARHLVVERPRDRPVTGGDPLLAPRADIEGRVVEVAVGVEGPRRHERPEFAVEELAVPREHLHPVGMVGGERLSHR
jgi:hypothetical protein